MWRTVNCLVLLSVFWLLTGCVAASKKAVPLDVEEMIRIAGVEDHRVQKKIREYFVGMRRNKAFSLDPYDLESCRWAYGNYSKKKVLDSVLDSSAKVLFAVNDDFVWEKELDDYLRTSLGRGRQAYQDRQYAKAIGLYEESVRKKGGDWYVYNRLGWAHLRLREYGKAEESFRQSLQYKSNDYSRLGLAEAFVMLGKYNEGREQLKRISSVKSDDEQSNAQYLLAVSHAAQGDFRKAHAIIGDWANLGFNLETSDDGLVVRYIYPGGPASYSGFLPGDRLVAIADTEVIGWDIPSYRRILRKAGIGSVMTIRFVRDNRMYSSQIVNGFTVDLPEQAAGLSVCEPQDEAN